MILTRRNFLKGLAGSIAAPAIIVGGIKRGVLMPVQEVVVPEIVVPDNSFIRTLGHGFFPGDIVQITNTDAVGWSVDELLVIERITKEGIFVTRGHGTPGIPFPVQQPERLTRIGTCWTESDVGPHERAAWQEERDERES